MKDIDIREKLNNIAKELFPNLQLDFHQGPQQWDVWVAHILTTTSIPIDRKEVSHNLPDKLKGLVKIRTRIAFLKLKDYVDRELEKL